MNRDIGYFAKKIDDKHLFVLIDVGAMGGVSLRKWKDLLPIMKIIGFEPDAREFCKLKSDNNIKYLNCALHNKSECLTLYITKDYGKSSIFKPNMNILSQYEDYQRFEVIQEEALSSARVKTLDSIINDNYIVDVDFVKLDTQGSELFILQGSQREVIPRVFGIQMEVEFIEMYKNQPLFRDVDGFMEDKDFQLIDLRRVYWKRKDYYNYVGKGELIFGDALYFKRIEVFRKELLDVDEKMWNRSKIFKGILICVAYRIFDYAVAIAKLGLETKYLTDVEYAETILHIKNIVKKGRFLRFHISSRLYDMVNTVLQKFKPPSYLGWADGDTQIGNVKAAD